MGGDRQERRSDAQDRAEGQGDAQLAAELAQQQQAKSNRAQARGGKGAAAQAMAPLGHRYRPNGQAHPAHGQQDPELGGAEHLDRRCQADGQDVERGEQAVKQHELDHGAAHTAALFKHLEAFANFPPNACASWLAGGLVDPDSGNREGCDPIANGQQNKFAVVDADVGQQPLQQPQDRIPEGKAHDRCSHAGGLIERIGGEQLGLGHQHRDRGLLGGSKKLGEHRFAEGDQQQSPVAPAQAQPFGAIDQTQGNQQGKAGP